MSPFRRQRRSAATRASVDLASCRSDSDRSTYSEATRSSAFACELRAADSPRPLAFISNLSLLNSRLVQGCPKLRLRGVFLQYSGPRNRSCACGKSHRVLRGMAHRGHFATEVLPVFPVSFWSTVLEATSKTLRDGVSILKGSVQECGDEANSILGYSSSPYSLMDSFGKFLGSSFPARAGASSQILASPISHCANPSAEGSSPMVSLSSEDVGDRGSSISSGVAGGVPTVGDGGFEQVCGRAKEKWNWNRWMVMKVSKSCRKLPS